MTIDMIIMISVNLLLYLQDENNKYICICILLITTFILLCFILV